MYACENKMCKKFLSINHIWQATLFCLVLLLCACGKEGNSLETQIRDIAGHPELQNEEGLRALADIIMSDPDSYRAYLDNEGNIDLAKLQKAVDRIGRDTDSGFSWDITAYGGIPVKDLSLNLFLERSGSMTGYDARSTSGDFKRTLNEIITRFPRQTDGATGSISIVNDNVYSHKGSFEEFVQNKDVFASTSGIGDPSYTDFASIFGHVLADTVAENINVLVTDLIYSPKGIEGVTPAKIFNEEQSLATSIFQKHSDKSVLVVKLHSDFDGMYYPYNSPQGGVRYKGMRPYYIVITGSAAAMHKLRHDSRYASFTDFASLPGYEAHYLFSRKPQAPGYYTVLPRNKASRGNFSLSGSNSSGKGVHALKELKGDNAGKILFQVAADLSDIAADPEYMLDAANYTIATDGMARIASVEAITPQMTDARNRRYLEGATHLFTIEADASNPGRQIELGLADKMPGWFKTSTSSDDTRTGSGFASTTFGLNSFLEGIYRAYHGTAEQPQLFTLNIHIEP